MVEALIESARRRIFINRALSLLALDGAIIIGVLALLLIVGTRFLDSSILWIVAVVCLVGSVVRVVRRAPDRYKTAVQVDRNADLSDALSTALHFSSDHSAFGVAQRRLAETAAGSVELDRAIPFTFPKELYAMAALALLASGLVAVRFYTTHGLDLKAPLTEVLFEDLAVTKQVKLKQSGAESTARQRLETAESLLAKLGVPTTPEDQKQPNELDKALDQALENPGSSADKGQKAQGDKAGGAPEKAPAGDPLEGQQQSAGDQKDGNKAPDGKDSGGADKNGSKPANGIIQA